MCPQSKTINQDWIRIPGEIGWARPIRNPARYLPPPRIGARGAVWAHIQIRAHCHILMCGIAQVVLYRKHCIEYTPTIYNCFLYNIHS